MFDHLNIRVTDEGVTVMGTEEPGTPLKQDPMRELAMRRAAEHREQGENFRKELAALLNKHSAEEHSNTPDFILARYLVRCLDAFTIASAEREEWYGVRLVPAQPNGPVQHINSGEGQKDG